jgi:glutamate decarboxylase
MLHFNNPKEEHKITAPNLAVFEADGSLPVNKLNKGSIPAQVAHRLLKDELIDEGNARQNLQRVCQITWKRKSTRHGGNTCVNANRQVEYPKMTEIEYRA